MSRIIARRRLLLSALALTLSGCATWRAEDRRESFRGRFSLLVRRSGTEESAAGSYRLEGHGESWSLLLLSPIGLTLARVDRQPGSARLTRPGQPDLSAGNEIELMEQGFGFAVPLTTFRRWLIGAPDPGESTSRLDEGRFRQLGWEVSYRTGATPGTAAIMRLTRHDPGRDIELRLSVTHVAPGQDE